ncbi:zinc finger BED domain-containing protein RICESLEEPER 1-like [Primulina huaijiensis]|uniref:zinc finger BED domain-containing protein RICESLEEPER 1-like n=1 Tax=Primulina huaijiensis TaxID=1492673 RepID=UPI003CC75850
MEFGGISETLSSPNIQPQSDLYKEVTMNIDDKVDEKDDKLCDSKKRTRTVVSRSQWWEHFERLFCENENVQKSRCKYCSREIKADPKVHGTKPLKNHYESCKKKPHGVETNQNRLSFQSIHKSDKDTSLVNWRFEQQKVRNALCYMLIVDELPFKTVENPCFRHFCLLQVQYTWTSIQKVNYMCLTSHFVDANWNLHKRILNFCLISGHKGEEIGKCIERCLLDWSIGTIFSITVDNASSNDGAIVYLQRKFDNWGNNILGGKYVHVRCIAHIMNLVVNDGLKGNDEHVAISRVRGAVRYIQSSPARYKRFQECVQLEKIETNKLLTLDVPTRWNSTYLMLESAICLKRAFDAYDEVDLAF